MTSLQRAIRLLDKEVGASLAPGPGFRICAGPRGFEGDQFEARAGSVGAGKTTAADLLLKLWEPGSGDIDGAVFRETLKENIRYKRPDATDEEVMAAAHSAGLERTLERLPDGLNTEIGEPGIGLSVGERQRLQIAARPLVLDGATMLVIAHRYTMVREADHVYVLRDGLVAEEGTPEELIAKDGWFADLARQSGQAVEDDPEAEVEDDD